jgi:glycerol-3-phosphate dehydrogenase (NAD(P)+)
MGLAERYGIEMPITREVYQVLRGEIDPRRAFRGLLRTLAGAESDAG